MRPSGTILFNTVRKIFSVFFISLAILSCNKYVDPESSCSSNDWEFYYIGSEPAEFFL